MIDISVIIVNYNVKEFLLNLLGSLQSALKQFQSEIIVVDNSSDDGSIEALKLKYPGVKLIINDENIGFGKANNQGLKLSNGKYILLINPDTIVRDDTVSKLIDFFESKPDVGMATCKVLNPDGSLQLSCRRGFPGPWTSFTKVTGLSKLFPNSKLFARYHLTYLDENETYEVDAISGAFMLLKKEVYKLTGGFDPDFFMYGEDLDLCYRTKKEGFKVYYVHSTEIIHYKGESTRRSSIDETKVFYDAMHLFVKKHFSTSFIVEGLLRTAIALRKIIAFSNIYRFIISGVIIDYLFFLGALLLAEKIYSAEYWNGFPQSVKPWIYFIPAAIQVMVAVLSGAYKKNTLSILRIFTSLILGLIFLSSITFFFNQFAYSRAVLLINYIILFFALPLWRVILKISLRVGQSEESRKRRTLVVGTGSRAVEIAGKLKSSFTNIHHVIGLIGLSRMSIGEHENNFEIIGSLDNIKKIILERKIEKVIFSSEEASYDQMLGVVAECQGMNVDFVVTGSREDYLVGKSSVTMLDDLPLLKVHYNISSITMRIAKSLFDFFTALAILLFIFPFIYSYAKVTGKKNDFINFILKVPKVFLLKKSFVGPQENSYYENLYIGKPGLTGLWYTENFDKSDIEEKNKLNIFYAKNQNVWLDMEILGKTFTKMFE